MSDFEHIQNLIRLKRHEKPDDSFVENFLTEFHQRQREDVLKRSARSLVWERFTTYFSDFFSPKWAYACVGAAAAIALTFFALNPAPKASGDARQAIAKSESMTPTEAPQVAEAPKTPTSTPKDNFGVELPFIGFAPEGVDIEPLLISRHFAGGYGDERMHAISGSTLGTDLIGIPFDEAKESSAAAEQH
ncbi:MAG: hypothetical protein KDK97_15960 [Verrucomicrobiales bacterium]|nr:hypothetical protein [Verrucomicrobiales bacterium]MCP5559355.1 hypothetical protein [Verrucomicrobiaceae bacterium]